MASTTILSYTLLSVFLILFTNTRAIPSEQLEAKFPPCTGNLSNFLVYAHTVFNGADATGLQVAGPKSTNSSRPAFGALTVSDKPLTINTNPKSVIVGKLEGLYASVAQKEVGVLLTANLVLYASKAPSSPSVQSTISVQGLLNGGFDVITIQIIGGTGDYDGIHGVMLVQKISENKNTAVVAYNFCYRK